MSHVVINSNAQRDLFKKRRLNSQVVPNVFNFDAPLWEKDEYNNDLRQDFGLDENDIIFLQATRVTNRKAIELAIATVAELNKQKESLIGKTLYDGRIITENTNFREVYQLYSILLKDPNKRPALQDFLLENNIYTKIYFPPIRGQ